MKNILIVEDDDSLRAILTEHFEEKLKFDGVDIAADGAEGLIKIRDNQYSLIYLDHNLPYMTGKEILDLLRMREGINQKTPVLMISSHLPELEGDNNEELRTFYLKKPIEVNRIDRYVKLLFSA
jgi:DNA-binding response OmpR family regulator